jgi:prevent-host-death family protein
MAIKTLSSREFNQNRSLAQKAAQSGPVIITDRGTPAYVLLSYQNYENIIGKKQNLIDLIGMPDGADIEFDPPRMGPISRPVDFD